MHAIEVNRSAGAVDFKGRWSSDYAQASIRRLRASAISRFNCGLLAFAPLQPVSTYSAYTVHLCAAAYSPILISTLAYGISEHYAREMFWRFGLQSGYRPCADAKSNSADFDSKGK